MTEDDMQKLAREIASHPDNTFQAMNTLRYLNERGMLIDEGAAERVAKAIRLQCPDLYAEYAVTLAREALYPAPVDDPDEVAAFELFNVNREYLSIANAKERAPQTFPKYVAAIRRGRELERGK